MEGLQLGLAMFAQQLCALPSSGAGRGPSASLVETVVHCGVRYIRGWLQQHAAECPVTLVQLQVAVLSCLALHGMAWRAM